MNWSISAAIKNINFFIFLFLKVLFYSLQKSVYSQTTFCFLSACQKQELFK